MHALRAFSFTDLEQQGRQILEKAQEQAREIVRNAELRGQEVLEQQKQAGYQAGLEKGRAAGLEQILAEARTTAIQEARENVAKLVQALSAALDEFEQNKRALITTAELGLIELALRIARRVCKLEAGASTATARANALALLEMVQHVADPALHINPAEHEQLNELAPELLTHVGRLGHVRIVADEDVGRGGCVLRASDGEIDAQIDTQLQRIATALRVNAGDANDQPAEEGAQP